MSITYSLIKKLNTHTHYTHDSFSFPKKYIKKCVKILFALESCFFASKKHINVCEIRWKTCNKRFWTSELSNSWYDTHLFSKNYVTSVGGLKNGILECCRTFTYLLYMHMRENLLPRPLRTHCVCLLFSLNFIIE